MESKVQKAIILHSAATGVGLVAGLLLASGKSHGFGTTIAYLLIGVTIGNAMMAPVTYLTLKDKKTEPGVATPV
jgi:uncharacterized membrane protein YebE (DUF533 family)